MKRRLRSSAFVGATVAGFLGIFCTLVGQEITLRVEAREVVVPFAVFSEKDIVQACPAPENLTVRENGEERPIRGVQTVKDGPIALGIVVEGCNGFDGIEKVETAMKLVRSLLRSDDGCLVVYAMRGRDLLTPRDLGVAPDRVGSLRLLEYLSERIRTCQCKEVVALPWMGTLRAAADLSRESRIRKGLVLLTQGLNPDRWRLSGGAKRHIAGAMIEFYSLYFANDKLSSTEIFGPEIAQSLKDIKEMTDRTGGRLYRVDSATAMNAAREMVDGLRSQCLLTYSPAAADLGTSWRSIEVSAAQKGWKVRHRPGYFPDKAAIAGKSGDR
jgi:hypothetical protein